ncbi:hypothetical protein [Thermococcus sp. Bubb.Bath]|uniref:hypothetical protein n=1 Tax=Thermococcus sp. Bubb.Bath TaxID=1638242 RepID=UPI00143A37B0|nr:hypothetical protein [Thermococcus sp. Bubb.Bath]NJF24412.1 hypothetical protein [Thermococcus sp. Bubb.Bath]
MGVYHISGLGKSPGALTMPLSIVYILQAGAQLGIKEAQDFFAGSGESERKGSYEKTRGMPEYVIVFDSPEVIDGKVIDDKFKLLYKSNWFDMKSKNRPEPIKEPIVRYINKLIGYLEDRFSVDLRPPKKLYLVRTDYQSFEDAFYKMGVTLEGLRRKEVWLNLIGGSNQMNLALLLAGAYTMVPSRYYYVFQSNAKMMEPSWIEKPSTEYELRKVVRDLILRWYDLPPLDLGFGTILRELATLFIKGNRERISKNELIDIFKKKNRGYDETFIPKLLGTRYLVSVEDNMFQKGEMLDRILEMFSRIAGTKVKNSSAWKKWADEKGILEEADFGEV